MSWVTNTMVVPRASHTLSTSSCMRIRVNWSSAEGFVQQKHTGVVDEGTGKGSSLGHAAAKLVRINVGKFFDTHQPHQLFNLVTPLPQDARATKPD